MSAFAVLVVLAGLAYAVHTLRHPVVAPPLTPTPSPTVSSPSGVTTVGAGEAGDTDVAGATSHHRHGARHPKRATSPTSSPSAVPHYRFPIADCTATYGSTHHDYPAADMFAARGCMFVAPVDGRVDEVTRDDTWSSSTNLGADRGGRSVSLVGVDGVRYYGSHLEEVLSDIRPGTHVTAGTPLGRVGDSGSAAGTGTHLHFAISWPTPAGYWWIRRGTVYPQPYLNSWRDGGQASPVDEVVQARAAYGDDSRCHTYC